MVLTSPSISAYICPYLMIVMTMMTIIGCGYFWLVTRSNSVHGFDHNALDRVQDDWHTHMFPYKLGNYRHKLLTKPSVLTSLDYTLPMADEGIIAADNAKKVPVVLAGRADAVVIWVDYQLSADSPDNCLRGWNGVSSASASASLSEANLFPNYLTVNLRFLPDAVSVVEEQWLNQAVEFVVGSSDFKYTFNVSN